MQLAGSPTILGLAKSKPADFSSYREPLTHKIFYISIKFCRHAKTMEIKHTKYAREFDAEKLTLSTYVVRASAPVPGIGHQAGKFRHFPALC